MKSNNFVQQSLQELANKNSMNRRRFSLGNFPGQQPETSAQKYPKPDMFTDQTNLQESTLARYLLQQQHQNQNQENISNLLKLCNNPQLVDSPPYHNENQNFFSQMSESSDLFLAPMSSINMPPNSNLTQIQNLQRRRASYCMGSSQLKPVIESRSSSPVFNQTSTYQNQLIQHQQNMLEQKLNLLASSAFMSPTTPTKKLSYSQQNLSQSTSSSFRSRASSLGIDSTNLLNSTGFTPLAIQNNKHLMENFEEKLATSGNIFQRREDWSFLKRLPVSKQNSIHIRLEDEGPFGNDETRCFVLSHLSSLCIREMNCVNCSCNLVIFDRFPLIDGTLFVSPFMYDKNKSIPAIVSNKQQYLNAVCIDCIIGTKNHEIKCKYCSILWQSLGAFSLQIGNLYKYDIFSAFPCCQMRLTCSKCSANIMDLDMASNEFFSSFSEQKECPQCRTKDYHFIKPLKDIFYNFEPIEYKENLINLETESTQSKSLNE